MWWEDAGPRVEKADQQAREQLDRWHARRQSPALMLVPLRAEVLLDLARAEIEKVDHQHLQTFCRWACVPTTGDEKGEEEKEKKRQGVAHWTILFGLNDPGQHAKAYRLGLLVLCRRARRAQKVLKLTLRGNVPPSIWAPGRDGTTPYVEALDLHTTPLQNVKWPTMLKALRWNARGRYLSPSDWPKKVKVLMEQLGQLLRQTPRLTVLHLVELPFAEDTAEQLRAAWPTDAPTRTLLLEYPLNLTNAALRALLDVYPAVRLLRPAARHDLGDQQVVLAPVPLRADRAQHHSQELTRQATPPDYEQQLEDWAKIMDARTRTHDGV